MKKEDIYVGMKFTLNETEYGIGDGYIVHIFFQKPFIQVLVNKSLENILFVVKDITLYGKVIFETVEPCGSYSSKEYIVDSICSFGFRQKNIGFNLDIAQFCALGFMSIEGKEPHDNNGNSREIHVDLGVKPEYSDWLLAAMRCAEDVATMEHVLLQLSRWFKTGHKELPVIKKDPFNNENANCLLNYICGCMKEETENGK